MNQSRDQGAGGGGAVDGKQVKPSVISLLSVQRRLFCFGSS